MADERNLYLHDFLDDCGNVDSYTDAKTKDEVDIIHQILQSGASFNSEKARELDFVSENPLEHGQADEGSSSTATTTAELPTSTADDGSTTTAKNKRGKALKHKCDTCSQVFDSRIALSIHSGRIHKSDGRDKNYQCHLCTKAFYNSSYLSQHMRIHTGLKPYECKVCQKKFTQLSHLQQHKRTHSGEKPYRCKQPGCTKAFSQLSNLQSHTRSHLPDGNVHKCTSCYKCYFDEASLTAHLRTHMVNKRVRNYRCEVCGKTYTQDTYLQNHINNKHGGASSIDKMAYAPRPVTRQPTSIQAATSMICKVEEPSTPCSNGTLNSPLMQHVQQQVSHTPGVINKLMPQARPSVIGPSPCEANQPNSYGIAEANYQRASVLQNTFSAPRREYEEHCSAFKPLPRPGIQDLDASMTGHNLQRNTNRQSNSNPTGGYDHLNSNILGLIGTQDAKQSMDNERQPEDSEMSYWRLRNNVAAAAGLGSYPSLNSHIQNYMGGSYAAASSYAAYINSPLESMYAADKASSLYHSDKCESNMFDSEGFSDYLIGGLREAYSLD